MRFNTDIHVTYTRFTKRSFRLSCIQRLRRGGFLPDRFWSPKLEKLPFRLSSNFGRNAPSSRPSKLRSPISKSGRRLWFVRMPVDYSHLCVRILPWPRRRKAKVVSISEGTVWPAPFGAIIKTSRSVRGSMKLIWRALFHTISKMIGAARLRKRGRPWRQPLLAALRTAFTEAVAISSSIPTPNTLRPSRVRHSR